MTFSCFVFDNQDKLQENKTRLLVHPVKQTFVSVYSVILYAFTFLHKKNQIWKESYWSNQFSAPLCGNRLNDLYIRTQEQSSKIGSCEVKVAFFIVRKEIM